MRRAGGGGSLPGLPRRDHVHHQHSGASTQLIIAAILALAFVLLLALQLAR